MGRLVRPPIYLPVSCASSGFDPGSCQNVPQWPLCAVLAFFSELSPDPFLNRLWLFFLSLPTSPLSLQPQGVLPSFISISENGRPGPLSGDRHLSRPGKGNEPYAVDKFSEPWIWGSQQFGHSGHEGKAHVTHEEDRSSW